MRILFIFILFSSIAAWPVAVNAEQMGGGEVQVSSNAIEKKASHFQVFLQKLSSATNGKQAANLVRQWINSPLKPVGKGLSRAQTLDSPKRAVNTLSFAQVAQINKALTALSYDSSAARRILLRGAAAEQWWPGSLTDIQQVKALKMLRSLDKTSDVKVTTKNTSASLSQAILKEFVITNMPTNTAGLEYIAQIAGHFSYHLSVKQRQTALKALNDAVFSGGKAKVNMSAAAFRHALLAADFFGMKDSQQAALVLQWINSSKTLDNASIYDLSYFLSFVQLIGTPAVNDQVQRARAQLINQIIKRAGTLSSSNHGWGTKIELASLISQAFGAANKQQSQAIAQSLKSAFKSPQKAAKLMDQTDGLVLWLMNFSDERLPALRAHVIASWVLNGSKWQQAGRLAWIAPVLAKFSSAEGKKALQHILNTVRQNPVLSAQVVASGPTSLNKMLGLSFQNKFAARMHQAAKDKKTLPLSFFTDLAIIDGASKSNGSSSLFIDTLTIYLNHGGTLKGDFKSFKTLGHTATSQHIIKQLRKQLTAPNGSARLGVAKILTWAYSADKDDKIALQKWEQYLKSQASNAKLSGDQQASWYLALSYLPQMSPDKLSAAPGLNWIIKAYTVSQSQSRRLWCARHIIQAYIDFEAFDLAREFLNKAKKGLSGQTAEQILNDLAKKLEQAQAKTARHNRQVAQKRRIDRIKGSIQHIQNLLAKAKKQNQPQENLQSLQTTITNLKQQLAQAKQQVQP